MISFGSFFKYFALAAQAVQEVQQTIGASGGNAGVQQGKAAAAIAIVLAAAHAGENVPVAVVQQVAAAVEMAVGIANSLGLFGKAAKGGTVTVPAAAPAA